MEVHIVNFFDIINEVFITVFTDDLYKDMGEYVYLPISTTFKRRFKKAFRNSIDILVSNTIIIHPCHPNNNIYNSDTEHFSYPFGIDEYIHTVKIDLVDLFNVCWNYLKKDKRFILYRPANIDTSFFYDNIKEFILPDFIHLYKYKPKYKLIYDLNKTFTKKNYNTSKEYKEQIESFLLDNNLIF
jgi:hypothetical protein